MTSSARELSFLVSALVDGDIDENQFARLNQLLESNPEARALYIRLMHHHADLPEVAFLAARENATQEELPDDCDSRPSLPQIIATTAQQALQIARRPTSISLTAAAVVVGLLVAAMGLVAFPLYQRAATEPEHTEKIMVAVLTRLHEAQWPPEYGERGPDRRFAAGERIDLRGGFAELTFTSGAKAVLQGPIVFEAVSAQSGYVDRGRLTVIVPEKAVGFSIRSPCMNAVDLGTEFGVLVEESGATNVEVFSGRVEVAQIQHDSTGAASPSPQRVTLTEGEAARIVREVTGIAKVAPSAEKFVRTESLNKMLDEHSLGRWRDFTATLKDDADVVALYTFERSEKTPDLLPNLTAAGQGNWDGRIDGAQWATGRWEDKPSLRFARSQDCVHLNFTGKTFEQLTLATWLRIDRLEQPLTAVVYSNDWNRAGAMHWTLLADGRVELAIFGSEPPVIKSDNALLMQRTGRWVHLAVVYDARAQHARFFVNGRSLGSRSYTEAQPVDLQKVQLGVWNQSSRNFLGKMGELIVFRRTLSDEEIQRIYVSGTP